MREREKDDDIVDAISLYFLCSGELTATLLCNTI